MNFAEEAWRTISRGVDDAAGGFVRAFGFVMRPRRILLVEQEGAQFDLFSGGATNRSAPDATLRWNDSGWRSEGARNALDMLKGSQIELMLSPRRFVFRDLELPRRAGAFLEGVVRSQVDRLAPWKAADASFGWSAPSHLAEDRMVLTVAITRRNALEALIQGLESLRVEAVTVLTAVEVAGNTPVSITLRSDAVKGDRRIQAVRFGMVAILGIVAFTLVSTFVSATFAGRSLAREQAELRHEIAARRAAITDESDPTQDPAVVEINSRKRSTPSAAIVMEALSRTLPDSAHLTQLHLEGDKVQLVGLADDPPSLIKLLEASPNFSHAAFTAPTTKSTNETGERFQIEAHVNPIFEVIR